MTNDVHSLIARARELLGRVPEGSWEAIGDPTEWGFKTVVMRDERFHESLRTVCEVTRLGETRHPTEPLEDETCGEDMALTELIAESRTLLPALADDAENMLGAFGAFLDEVERKGRRWVPKPNSGGEYVYDELATKARALKAEFLEGK